MAGKDRTRQTGATGSQEAAGGQVTDIRGLAGGGEQAGDRSIDLPSQTPLFHAQHAERYRRQEWIGQYEQLFQCRLIVLIDVILHPGVALVEELIYDADPDQDLHMILYSPGGDGEAAIRIVRSIQRRCRELTVIVPDMAKSAATILAMGAHWILMGPTSDLGPVDPQFQIGTSFETLISAKDIIAAVAAAEAAITAQPDTYPLHAALLSDVTALQVQQARSAMDRTGDLVEEALKSHPDRTNREVQRLKRRLQKPLIDLPNEHSAVFGASDAKKVGLPVIEADPLSDQWQRVWRLFAKYLAMGAGPRVAVYEGIRASHIIAQQSPEVST